MTNVNQAPLPRLSKRRWYMLHLLSGAISSTWLYLYVLICMQTTHKCMDLTDHLWSAAASVSMHGSCPQLNAVRPSPGEYQQVRAAVVVCWCSLVVSTTTSALTIGTESIIFSCSVYCWPLLLGSHHRQSCHTEAVYQALHGIAPCYLSSLLFNPVADWHAMTKSSG